MPPKARITREMIVTAAFHLTREEGIENVNARTVSQRLLCSTQPIMYCFKTVEEMKQEVYAKADAFHTEYLMQMDGEEPLLSIGLNYIRFAHKEKHLFRLLFQTDGIKQDMEELLNVGELSAIIQILQEELGIEESEARDIFSMLAFFTHGYATLLANNSIQYHEASAQELLKKLFDGACATAQMPHRNGQ